MSVHNICLYGEIRKKYFDDTPSYLELCIKLKMLGIPGQ